jgi:hypothetical protein
MQDSSPAESLIGLKKGVVLSVGSDVTYSQPAVRRRCHGLTVSGFTRMGKIERAET